MSWQDTAAQAAECDERFARRRGHFDAAVFFQNQAARIRGGELTRADFRGQTRLWRERLWLSGCTDVRSMNAKDIAHTLDAPVLMSPREALQLVEGYLQQGPLSRAGAAHLRLNPTLRGAERT